LTASPANTSTRIAAIPRMTAWTRSIGRYLCTSGSPTLMLDAVPPDSDTDAFVEPTIGAAWLSFPLSGKHISFDGRQGGAACLMPTSQSHQCVDRHCAFVVLSADPVSGIEHSAGGCTVRPSRSWQPRRRRRARHLARRVRHAAQTVGKHRSRRDIPYDPFTSLQQRQRGEAKRKASTSTAGGLEAARKRSKV